MTECERLIANGTFTLDFFKPEVRCDFLVPEERKKIWAIGLDLLRQFDLLCRSAGLRYFLAEGSLLGAVRHGGFIPWDDDIDIGMFRSDYEKLKTLKESVLDPYFLQVPGTEAGLALSFMKFRNSRTTALSKPFAFESFNQGLAIDIFPFDDVVLDKGKEVFSEINLLNIDNSTCMRMSNPYLGDGDCRRVDACTRKDIGKNLHEIDALARCFEGQECDGVGMLTNTIYSYERHTFKKEDFASFKQVEFEGLDVPIPCGFDRVLRTVYGEYMTLPEPSQRGGWHDSVVFDADIPYQEYLAQYRESCHG